MNLLTKAEVLTLIDELYEEARTAIKTQDGPLLSLETRKQAVEALAEYGHGLDKLTDILLLDELLDTTPYKTRNTEYPFLSPGLLGKKSALDSEYVTENEGARPGERRKRSRYENALLDKNARSRNKERRKDYRDFISGKTDGWLCIDIK